MPIPKLCSHPACKNISRDGNHKCYLHRQIRKRSAKAIERSGFYNETKWKQLSKSIRMQRPVCEICNKELTNDLDHWLERSIDHNDEFEYDQRNLVCLCKSCHTRKTTKLRKLITDKDYHKIYQWLINNHPRNETSYLHEWIRDIETRIKQGTL